MGVRRGAVAGLVGLVLLVVLAGATGCSLGEKVATEAIERNSDCQDVDIDVEDVGVSGTCGGDEIDASLGGEAELPSEWPAALATPDGFQISTGTATGSTVRTIEVVGSVDGEVPAVYETVKAQLAAAGFTIDLDSMAEVPTGPVGTLGASSPELAAAVSVSGTVGPLPGDVTVTYTLTSVAG